MSRKVDVQGKAVPVHKSKNGSILTLMYKGRQFPYRGRQFPYRGRQFPYRGGSSRTQFPYRNPGTAQY